MNALTPILEERTSIQARHIARMAKLAAEWAKRPGSDWRAYEFLDALRFCIDSDLSREMEDIRHDLRFDKDGRPLTDEGDTIWNADLVYAPLEALS